MIILYGNDNYRIDVTDLVREKFTDSQDKICIPTNDHMRAKMFSDPCFGETKFVKIFDDSLNSRIYPSHEYVHIDWDCNLKNEPAFKNTNQIKEELANIVKDHKLVHNHKWSERWVSGHDINITDSKEHLGGESYEQMMTLRFLSKDAKVLELGGNIGRNSMLIGTLLNNKEHHVVLETSPDIANCLKRNRDQNNMRFHVEDAALSKRRLVQKRESWQTVSTDDNVEDTFVVRNITLPELQNKYGIQFDTLIADCEGGLFHLLQDDPSVLDNIKMIIVENDYFDQSKQEFVENLYIQKGFKKVYTENHPQVQMRHDMFFFEVWVR